MEDLETYLFEAAEEIKKDFGIEADIPKIQNLSAEVFEKASKRKDFFNFMVKDFSNLGFHLSSVLSVDTKKKEISMVHSPLIVKEESVDETLHSLLLKNAEKIERDDKKRIFSYIILTPVYLEAKLDSAFPYFHPHFLSIPKLIHLAEEMTSEGDIQTLLSLTTLSTIHSAYEMQTQTFHTFYLSKKIKEIKEKYMNFLPEHFSFVEDLDIDYKNPQKYFEFLKLFLPYLKKMGLRLQGKYRETIFTKSLDEYFNYSTTPQTILWMFGIDISSKTPAL